MIRAIIILVSLSIALGCGKEETPETPSKSDVQDSKIGQPKVDPTKHKRFLWEFKTGAEVYSSPAIGPDGTVYVGSRNKKLYAIKTASNGLAQSPWPMRGQNAGHTGRVMKK